MTQGAIQPGSDIVFANGPSTNLPAWKLRYGGDSGLDIQLVRFDSSGAPVDVSVTVDWATGNVTLVTDLTIDDVTLDDAMINDLTVTGTHIFTAASALLDIGATAVGSAGSPNVNLKKLATGTASLTLQSVEAGAYATRGLVRLDASENIILQHNDATGAEDATVTVGADAVTIAAATTTWPDAGAALSIGGSSGSPAINIYKGDTGTATLTMNNGGGFTTRFALQLDANEKTLIQHNDSGGSTDSRIEMSAALVDVAQGVLLTSGGLRTGYRSLGADAAATLAATDDVVELNSGAGSKAVTMTATAAGHVVRVYATTVTGGDYTLACTRGATGGTVTLNATGEGCVLSYSGSAWKLLELTGGATFA